MDNTALGPLDSEALQRLRQKYDDEWDIGWSRTFGFVATGRSESGSTIHADTVQTLGVRLCAADAMQTPRGV